MIAIVKYNAGNISSVKNALDRLQVQSVEGKWVGVSARVCRHGAGSMRGFWSTPSSAYSALSALRLTSRQSDRACEYVRRTASSGLCLFFLTTPTGSL